MLSLLSDYKSPNDKISELLKSGQLIPIRRGLYAVGHGLDLPTPELFVIANQLRGPSYISLESALSYWGLIPERVYEITSVTTKAPKTYKNPLGRFSYKQLRSPYYTFGITNIQLAGGQTALIATPEKALTDKVVLTPGVNLRSIKQTTAFLLDDLRLDLESLNQLSIGDIATWSEFSPKKRSLEMLVKTLGSLK